LSQGEFGLFRNAVRIAKSVWLLIAVLAVAACQPVVAPTPAVGEAPSSDAARLVVYSGRSENLVDPIIARFGEESGIQVEVRYGGTSELAATILEEGDNSPADVFFAQDAGALGALAKAGRLAPLGEDILALVPAGLESRDGDWVGISGRARVLVYNTSELTPEQLPDDVWGLTAEAWRGRVGWAPTNGSFQAFVTALRVLEGEERAQEWLEAMLANDVQPYPNNSAIVEATAAGEISVGLVNHYYLYRFLAEQGETFPARNYYFRTPHAGSMINVAGVGVLTTAKNPAAAAEFVKFLLSQEAQQFFANETFEYPLVAGDITVSDILVPLNEIATPDLDLSDLDDLQGTLELLQSVGALEQ
jgi:iron(III) transport system substrate-binding protein